MMSSMERSFILKKFGSKIRLLRNQKKLSQEKLALKAGLHWTYISGIERGQRNISLLNIIKIARALDEPVTKLVAFKLVIL